MPLVSVILTTYNRKELLRNTINSILLQSFQDFELIIVDNFSNYDFIGFIKTFESSKIKAYQNENNGIISINRNFAINRSCGKYIAFCDDDDVWLPEKLKIQLKFMEEENCDLIYSNTILMYDDNKLVNTKYENISNLKQLLYKNQITLSSVMVKKSKEVYFCENSDLIALEDYDLWINLMLKGFKFKLIQTPLLYYRVNEFSVSRQSKYKNENKKLFFLFKLFKNKEIPLHLKYNLFRKSLYVSFRLTLFLILKK